MRRLRDEVEQKKRDFDMLGVFEKKIEEKQRERDGRFQAQKERLLQEQLDE